MDSAQGLVSMSTPKAVWGKPETLKKKKPLEAPQDPPSRALQISMAWRESGPEARIRHAEGKLPPEARQKSQGRLGFNLRA